MTDDDIRGLVDRARSGDRLALDELVREISDLVHRLASRMLGDLTDAEDATQEILIKLVTSLDSFRGDSAFRTWVYRVASNHLLTTRAKRARNFAETFDELSTRLEAGIASGAPEPEDKAVSEEAKLICTSMMLQCLDREHRLAFVLGEMLELSGEEAAAALDLAPDAYRKRLSRARTRMTEFVSKQCGLADESLPCSCTKLGGFAVRQGYIDPSRLTWVKRARPKDRAHVAELDALERAVEVFRALPDIDAPAKLADQLRELIDGGRVGVLS
jgi:RNA polymerase sigma factor (sigma-70 family)